MLYSATRPTQVADTNNNQQEDTQNDQNNQNEDDENDSDEDDSPNNDEEEVSNTRLFRGIYVEATIPTQWNIIEYSNSQGLYEGAADAATFSGLTGFEIVDENSNVVFKFAGVLGIGGAGGCSSVAQFADTEASYIQMVRDERAEFELDPTQVIDYTNADYVQIFVFGRNIRRVESQLYVAREENPTVFNTACGIDENFIVTNEFAFNVTDEFGSYVGNAYYFGIEEGVSSESKLTLLDDVLNSLHKVM